MTKLRNATDSIRELILWFLVALAAAIGSYAGFEHVAIWDATWWSWVTGATVGYGDMFPKTVGGRLTAMAWMTFMFIWGCIFTARLAAHMIVSNDAFTHDEQEEIKDGIREIRELLTERERA